MRTLLFVIFIHFIRECYTGSLKELVSIWNAKQILVTRLIPDHEEVSGYYTINTESLDAEHRQLISPKRIIKFGNKNNFKDYKQTKGDYFLHLSQQNNSVIWQIVQFESSLLSISNVREVVFDITLTPNELPTGLTKEFPKISMWKPIDNQCLQLLVPPKQLNETPDEHRIQSAEFANNSNNISERALYHDTMSTNCNSLFTITKSTMIWMSISCVTTVIIMLAIFYIIIRHHTKKAKEVNNLFQITQNMNQIPAVLDKKKTQRQNSRLKAPRKQKIKNPLWEPENMKQIIENGDAVQQIVMDDIVEEMGTDKGHNQEL